MSLRAHLFVLITIAMVTIGVPLLVQFLDRTDVAYRANKEPVGPACE